MKGLKALVATLIAVGLLAAAVPASSSAAAYVHYVACGLSGKEKPSHSCPAGSKKGAFFKSTKRGVSYSICVRFPNGKSLCAQAQPQSADPQQGVLYVNKITSTIRGLHRVTWFVEGKRVGAYYFRVT